MSYVPLEKLIDKSNGSLFKLVTLASKRALELAEGAPRYIEVPMDTKVTTLAMMEISLGKLRLASSGESKEEKTSEA